MPNDVPIVRLAKFSSPSITSLICLVLCLLFLVVCLNPARLVVLPFSLPLFKSKHTSCVCQVQNFTVSSGKSAMCALALYTWHTVAAPLLLPALVSRAMAVKHNTSFSNERRSESTVDTWMEQRLDAPPPSSPPPTASLACKDTFGGRAGSTPFVSLPSSSYFPPSCA